MGSDRAEFRLDLPRLMPSRSSDSVPSLGAYKLVRALCFATSLAVIVIILFLILYPLALAVGRAFAPQGVFELQAFTSITRIRGIGVIVWNTVAYGFGTLFGSLAIGCFLAWVNERTDARIDFFSGILPILPLIIPSIGSALGYVLLFSPKAGVGNIFVRQLFGLEIDTGPFDIMNIYGMIYVSSLHLAPLAYLLITAALRNIDPALDEASRVSGASPFTTLRRVTLPMILPGLAGAALLSLVGAVGSFTVPFIIGAVAGVTTVPVHVFRLFSTFPTNEGQALSLSLCLLVVVYVGVLIQMRITRSIRRAVIGSRHAAVTPVRLGWLRWPVRAVLLIYMGAVFIPVIGLLLGALLPFVGAPLSEASLKSFVSVLTTEDTRSALIHSIALAALTATATIATAFIIIYASTHLFHRGQRFLELVMVTPSMIPHVLIAVAFIIAFSGSPFYLYGTLTLIFLAMVTIYLPEASRAVAAALGQLNEELSSASRVAGGGFIRTLWRVVLPQIAGGLMAGWVIVFFYCVNEVTAAAFLGGLNARVIGQITIDYYVNGRLSEVAALALIVTSLTAVLVLPVRRYL